MFTPPSGRFIFFIILATVPISYKSLATAFSSSVFESTRPIKPFASNESSTIFTSSGLESISGVKIPGKIGCPLRTTKGNFRGSACSTVIIELEGSSVRRSPFFEDFLDFSSFPVAVFFSFFSVSSFFAEISPSFFSFCGVSFSTVTSTSTGVPSASVCFETNSFIAFFKFSATAFKASFCLFSSLLSLLFLAIIII